jgi:hypothetical protein
MSLLYPIAEPSHRFERNLRAERTGEMRKPRKGEWYLSGAIIEAYRAPNDLTVAYPIARIVKTRTATVTSKVED